MKKKALFIDRDGVINKMSQQKDGYFDSPRNPDEVTLVDGAAEIIAYINKNNIPVIKISNQPGVARGKMDVATRDAIEERFASLLKSQGAHIDASYNCLHHPNAIVESLRMDCDCRKPKPGLLLQATKDLDIDLGSSVFLGDNISDMEAGIAAGTKVIFFYHEDADPDTIQKKKNYKTEYVVTSHEESLAVIKNIFNI